MTYPSDNHRYFVNNFSRVNTTPESHLINSEDCNYEIRKSRSKCII